MTKETFFIICFALSGLVISAQENQMIQDPAAGEILERVAQKTRSMQSLQTDFELIINDRKEGTSHTSTGKLVLKKNRYRLTSEGSVIYFDGQTMWTFVPDNNEVTIAEPEDDDDNLLSNPMRFFDQYKTDYKYKYIRETLHNGVMCHEIDLFPKNLNQPYSRIKAFVNTKTDLPESITSVGKNGIDYKVNLHNAIYNVTIADTEFVFDPSKHRKVEVIDMRGL
jgi:outer membrane lipoprotein-sorting protein